MGLRSAFFWGLAALGVFAGLAWGFWPRPLPVDLAPVVRGPLAVFVAGEGRTRVRDVYVVSAPVAGMMRRIGVEVGDTVTAGHTILAIIEPADPAFLDRRSRTQAEAGIRAAEAALALAEAELARSTAGRDFAAAELARAEALAEQSVASRRALERAGMELRTARAIVATAEAAIRVRRSELDSARAALIAPSNAAGIGGNDCCVEIRAPVDGRVLTLIEKSEKAVAAGVRLAEVGDPMRLEVVADLRSGDAVRVAAGAPAVLRRWGGGGDLPARVRRVEPSGVTKVSALGIEEQRVDVVLDLEGSDVPERLGHGYEVDVAITVDRRSDTLKVPVSALFRVGDDWCVFVAGNRAQLRRVEIGLRNESEAEVAGLREGDRVIVYPSDQVEDGARIRARAPAR